LSGRSILADVNVWLATVLEPHPHHQAVVRWWRDAVLPSGDRVALCRITQLGLVRLLTNEQVMGKERQTNAQAWEVQKRLLSQTPVFFADEPEGVETTLEELANQTGSSPGFWSDAYLAAFARAAGWSLVSFDRGFRRFPELALDLLS
jgi:toxin-antitoxin system PIN domain toxin